jgi:integrase
MAASRPILGKRKARSSDSGSAARMRPSPERTDRADFGSSGAPRRSLGHSGFGGKRRTHPDGAGAWVKKTIDDWLSVAQINQGNIFRCVCRKGAVWGTGITEKVVWHVVREYAARLGIAKLAPHDLRRSCARLCHGSGGELEQIQFLLGHVSVQTTEKYLGCKQRLRHAVNDRLGIEPAG